MSDDERQDSNNNLDVMPEGCCFPAREKDMRGANDEALKLRLMALEIEHGDLDAAIHSLSNDPSPQNLVIARLKKKKLKLKDELTRLRNLVTPDIIA